MYFLDDNVLFTLDLVCSLIILRKSFNTPSYSVISKLYVRCSFPGDLDCLDTIGYSFFLVKLGFLYTGYVCKF